MPHDMKPPPSASTATADNDFEFDPTKALQTMHDVAVELETSGDPYRRQIAEHYGRTVPCSPSSSAQRTKEGNLSTATPA
jgi:hypothetical protein